MNMGTTKFLACAALLLATMAYSLSVVRADDNPVEKQREALNKSQQALEKQRDALNKAQQAIEHKHSFMVGKFEATSRVRTTPAAAIRTAAEAVRDAKGEEPKSEAQKNLTDILSKCYDDDMAAREDELKQIAERLSKLRELLDRRRAKKQDIIDLQTKVALNEADGLGFYDSERQPKGGATSSMYAPVQIDAAFGSGNRWGQPATVVPLAPQPAQATVPQPAPQPVFNPKDETTNAR